MAKTPTEAIQEALARLPSTQLFTDEKSAMAHVEMMAKGFLQYQIHLMTLTPDEREELDPIEAGMVQAKDIGTRPRRQRIPWIDRLLNHVAEQTFCEVMPLSGTMATWLVGRRTNRATALRLLGSLVPTGEKLGQDAYLREYHSHRKAGNVEAARGFKDGWLDRYVDGVQTRFAEQLSVAEREYGTDTMQKLSTARNEVVAYMNENFLPTRGNQTARLRR